MFDAVCMAAIMFVCIFIGGEVVSIWAPKDRSIGGLCGIVVAVMICVVVLG